MVACIEEISRWMTGIDWNLNTDKTQFIWHGTRVQLTKVDINSIVLDGVNIPVLAEVRCLGVVLDGELTFASHTRTAVQKLLLPTSAALVGSPSSDEGCGTDVGARIHSESNRLLQQCLQSCLCSSSPTTAIRPSFRCTSDSPNTEVRSHLDRHSWRELHWLPVHHRIQFKTCALVHKCLHGLAPSYLIDMIRSVSKEPGRRHLRSAAHGDLVVPASLTKTLGPRAFAISGPDSWNNIPVALRDTALSFHEFCVELKTELYRQINWNWTISAFVTVSTVRSFSARWTNFSYLLTYLLT